LFRKKDQIDGRKEFLPDLMGKRTTMLSFKYAKLQLRIVICQKRNLRSSSIFAEDKITRKK